MIWNHCLWNIYLITPWWFKKYLVSEEFAMNLYLKTLRRLKDGIKN